MRKGATHKFTKSNSEGELLVFTDDFILKHLSKTESQKSVWLFNQLIGSPKVQLDKVLFLEVITILEQIKNEVKLEKDSYSSGIKRSLLHILILKLYRKRAKDIDDFTNTKYLNQFIKFQYLIEEQWSESKTVLHYAKQMSVTPKTLNNITKSTMKKSAKSIIDNIATMQIKRLLINTELSVTEIAYQSGFNDLPNFLKYFKKNTSLSTNQFRKKHE